MRYKSAALLATGALLGISGTYLLSHRAHALVVEPASFDTRADSVSIKNNAIHFETTKAESGRPLVNLPLTARVTLVEAKTGPSFAPLEGRVAEVSVKLGDRVKKGDRLVLVSSADLAALTREYQAASLSVRTKQAMLDRTRLVVESRAASANDLLVAESELAEAKLSLGTAGAKMRSLSVNQSGENAYWVVANRAGVVVQLEAAKGKEVGPDKDHPVATVADLDEVLVIADLPSRQASSLKIGESVEIRRAGGGTAIASGSIERIADSVDSERQTVPVSVRVPNPAHDVRPNEYVEAIFTSGAEGRVVTVPTDAVVSDGAVSVVFIEEASGDGTKYTKHSVVVGRQAREQTEILSGVLAGDRVVSRGALLLLNAVGGGK
jgi:membrane fusion protein, heavy metal efflux system